MKDFRESEDRVPNPNVDFVKMAVAALKSQNELCTIHAFNLALLPAVGLPAGIVFGTALAGYQAHKALQSYKEGQRKRRALLSLPPGYISTYGDAGGDAGRDRLLGALSKYADPRDQSEYLMGWLAAESGKLAEKDSEIYRAGFHGRSSWIAHARHSKEIEAQIKGADRQARQLLENFARVGGNSSRGDATHAGGVLGARVASPGDLGRGGNVASAGSGAGHTVGDIHENLSEARSGLESILGALRQVQQGLGDVIASLLDSLGGSAVAGRLEQSWGKIFADNDSVIALLVSTMDEIDDYTDNVLPG